MSDRGTVVDENYPFDRNEVARLKGLHHLMLKFVGHFPLMEYYIITGPIIDEIAATEAVSGFDNTLVIYAPDGMGYINYLDWAKLNLPGYHADNYATYREYGRWVVGNKSLLEITYEHGTIFLGICSVDKFKENYPNGHPIFCHDLKVHTTWAGLRIAHREYKGIPKYDKF